MDAFQRCIISRQDHVRMLDSDRIHSTTDTSRISLSAQLQIYARDDFHLKTNTIVVSEIGFSDVMPRLLIHLERYLTQVSGICLMIRLQGNRINLLNSSLVYKTFKFMWHGQGFSIDLYFELTLIQFITLIYVSLIAILFGTTIYQQCRPRRLFRENLVWLSRPRVASA